MQKEPNRREVLVGGLLLGAGLFVGGCAGGGRSGASRLPGPLWPDQVRANKPAPQAPVTEGPAAATPVHGVIPRRAWASSGPIMALANPMNGINRITVHHDAMNSYGVRSQADAAARLAKIRQVHVGKGWADIGYHYIIDPAGRIWEGRPVHLQGAHVSDTNEHNLGIMLMGNFDEQRPTSEALATLDGFLADRMRALRVPLSRIYTHQELKPTACPGRSLQAYMLDTRARTGRLARV